MRLQFLLLTFLFGACIAYPQFKADPEIQKHLDAGIEFTYNLEFARADAEFSEVIRKRPDKPIGHFFKAMVTWWRILVNFENESFDARFYRELELVIDLTDKTLDKDPNDLEALFFKGGAIGFRGRLLANRGSYIKAAYDGVRALPIVWKAYALDKENYDILLGIGIYNYYAAVIPEKYPFVKPFMAFLPSGNRKEGLEQLRRASEKGRYAAIEATYFLMTSYQIYEKNYRDALPLSEKLHKRFPNNPIFHRYLGRAYVSIGFWNLALDIFNAIEKNYNEKKLGYDLSDHREAVYYFGKFAFDMGNFPDALKWFRMCDAASRTLDKEGASGFMVMANLYLGMTHDALGQRSYATAQYNKVLKMKEFESAQSDARRFLKTPYKR